MYPTRPWSVHCVVTSAPCYHRPADHKLRRQEPLGEEKENNTNFREWFHRSPEVAKGLPWVLRVSPEAPFEEPLPAGSVLLQDPWAQRWPRVRVHYIAAFSETKPADFENSQNYP